MKHPLRLGGALLVCAAVPAGLVAQTTFADLTLEQLLAVPIVSASKKASTLGETAAAVTRLSGQEVLDRGALTLAEALRGVPGVNIGQISSSAWAISVRGFQNEYANKLLVLVDGRPVYAESFGGVFWGEQDLVLADLESVEVIRGPGGTLWGANAMNGVINFTTKSARETQGGHVSVVYGTDPQPIVSVRQGGEIAPGVYYRAWAKFQDRGELELANGSDAAGGWLAGRGGFRVDWERSENTDLVFETEAFSGREDWIDPVGLFVLPGTPIPTELDYRGGHVRARLVHRQSDDARLEVQASYGVSRHDTTGFTIDDRTLHLDAQQQFKLGERHDIVAGVGYARADNRMIAGLARLDPASAIEDTFSAFAQDEITLVDALRFTLGTKYEHNDITGSELQPSARLLWRPTPHQSYWTAVSRAVRTPSRLNRVTYTAPGLGGPMSGNPIELVAEELLATELGARVEFSDRLSVDVALFHHEYDNLVTSQLEGPFFGPMGPFFQLVQSNSTKASSYGGEFSVNYQPVDRWKLGASVSAVEIATEPDGRVEDESPKLTYRFESTVQLAANWQWLVNVQHVDEVPAYSIPAYWRVDTGVSWKINDALSASLWLQNALDPSHPEYTNNTLPLLEVPRSVYARLTWNF